MQFKDFLQWIRATGERYVVLDHDGEPEFVIEPFAPLHPASSSMNESVAHQDFSNRDVTGFRQNPSTSSRHEKSTVEKINETLAPLHPASSSMNESASYRDFSDRDVTGLAAVAENERQEVSGWDAMAETLHERTPSPEGEGGGEVPSTEKKHDEPLFQFETIDE